MDRLEEELRESRLAQATLAHPAPAMAGSTAVIQLGRTEEELGRLQQEVSGMVIFGGSETMIRLGDMVWWCACYIVYDQLLAAEEHKKMYYDKIQALEAQLEAGTMEVRRDRCFVAPNILILSTRPSL